MRHSAYDIHLVCGGTGAGKSTYSNGLALGLRGTRFSIDEWMQVLHSADKSLTADFDWFYERVQRNCLQMRNMAEQLVPLDMACIFDCGFTNRQERDIFVNWAEELGYSVQLHFLDVAADVRWQRVEKRNREQAETFQFEVTRFMFDFIESIWEAPSSKEMASLNGVLVTD